MLCKCLSWGYTNFKCSGMDKNHKIKIFNSINAVNSKTGAGFLLNNVYCPLPFPGGKSIQTLCCNNMNLRIFSVNARVRCISKIFLIHICWNCLVALEVGKVASFIHTPKRRSQPPSPCHPLPCSDFGQITALEFFPCCYYYGLITITLGVNWIV